MHMPQGFCDMAKTCHNHKLFKKSLKTYLKHSQCIYIFFPQCIFVCVKKKLELLSRYLNNIGSLRRCIMFILAMIYILWGGSQYEKNRNTFFTLYELWFTSHLRNNSYLITSSGGGYLQKQEEQACKCNICLPFIDHVAPRRPSVSSRRSALGSCN